MNSSACLKFSALAGYSAVNASQKWLVSVDAAPVAHLTKASSSKKSCNVYVIYLSLSMYLMGCLILIDKKRENYPSHSGKNLKKSTHWSKRQYSSPRECLFK